MNEIDTDASASNGLARYSWALPPSAVLSPGTYQVGLGALAQGPETSPVAP